MDWRLNRRSVRSLLPAVRAVDKVFSAGGCGAFLGKSQSGWRLCSHKRRRFNENKCALRQIGGNYEQKRKQAELLSRNELIAKIEALNEWETLMEEAKTEADAIRSSIKAEMEERGVEELQAGSYIIRWTSVLSTRFDSAAFKRVHDDL